MHNWDASDEAGSCAPTCTSAADLEDAKQVCEALDIPLFEADFVSQYWTSVFAAFLEGLEQGLTPNPDLACNSHIKFGALLHFAQQKGADVLATGHYARLGWQKGGEVAPAAAAGDVQQQQQQRQPVLLAGADPLKDQTYFLAGLSQQQLASAMFPVGHLCKAVVRRIAAEFKLPMAAKRSSAGICFIGRRSFGKFLEDYLPPKPGVYVEVDSGRELGGCANMLAVTVGQRAVGLGGQQQRVYVVCLGSAMIAAHGPTLEEQQQHA
ncbi:hypothetical protein OEZ85_004959 [Tetradesmus obliquus]|uniref:tRNA-5-taurinomethyluridine 2-sulfurtransferase n=1 Tax=Tetradesmus obliquus TaxID=3088 RepID=A0ABY8UHR1_TETOB|nr:hypothetical protein OEZ85_004959 [Tetradesmus obliquus]